MQFDRVIMYLRKSRDDVEREKETGEDTLQAHRERLSSFLQSRGIKWEERAEVKTGDTIAGRPVFQRVLKEDMPSGRFQAVCVTEISRLGRGDMEDAGRIYKALIKHNIWIITPYKDYNPENPADLRQIRFELFLSREEYELIRERLEGARDQRGKQGYAACYIVTLGYDQHRGKLIVIPEESELVREIFEMRSENMSFREIAEVLNLRGLKTKRGTKYHNTTINRIINNPRYIGKSKWRGEYYESKGPAIVPLELWNRVHQEIQPLRVHYWWAKEYRPYLLIPYCHHCGSKMYGEKAVIKQYLKNGEKRKYNEYGLYVCTGRRNTPKCTHRQRAAYVNDLLLAELKLISSSREILESIIAERENRLSANTDDLKYRVEVKLKSIKEKEALLEKCKGDYRKGELSAALYSEIHEEVVREIAILKRGVDNLWEKIRRSAIKIEAPEKILLRLRFVIEKWPEISNSEKRAAVSSFFSRVEIDKAGNIYIDRRFPDRL